MGWLEDTLFGTGKSKDRATLAAQTAATGIREGYDEAAFGMGMGTDTEAAEIQKGIDYLQQREELPIELRDKALSGLGGYYQVPGQQMNQQQLIEQAMASPLYGAILGGRKAGEESILRHRSVTGGLRSGGSQKDLYDYNVELENEALLSSYYEAQERQDYERMLNLQGLEGLASLQGNEGEIARMMADRGEVFGKGMAGSALLRGQGTMGSAQEIAQGITGRAEIGAQSKQSLIDTALGGAAIYYSDIRLKDNIRYLGTSHGLNFYGWTWNEIAAELGLEGECSGVMAHEVYEDFPEATSEKDGFIQIDYRKIGVLH